MNPKLLGTFKSVNKIITFDEVVVISHIVFVSKTLPKVAASSHDLKLFIEEKGKIARETKLNDVVCRYLKFDVDVTIEVYLGTGYFGVKEHKWDELFLKTEGWGGGDGFYTFNPRGSDQMNQKKENTKTLCVFGDTFVDTASKISTRLDPLLMLNNSYAVFTGVNPHEITIDFYLNQDEKGRYLSYLEPKNALSLEGCMATNLTLYNGSRNLLPYMSSYNPQSPIELVFTFNKKQLIDSLDIYNYFIQLKEDLNIEGRGIKNIKIYYKNGNTFEFLKEARVQKAAYHLQGSNQTTIEIKQLTSAIKIVIDPIINEGNYGGANNNEGLFGFNKIYFKRADGSYLLDVAATANYEYFANDIHAWLWLQDGIILNNKFYTLPLVVSSDKSQPEGFQFRIDGIALMEIPLKNETLVFSKTVQKATNLHRIFGNIEYLFGAAIFDNSAEDGYIYIYGYATDKDNLDKGKRLVVARVKPKDFTKIDQWKFYNGKTFTFKMEELQPILDHVSCEMSVSKDGDDYVAVFSYDVQSPYIAYSLGKTPYGKFATPRVAYVCDEDLAKHMYIYNAKAHPHLSKDNELLVSYNVNTSNFDENINNAGLYRPRFVTLKRSARK